MKKIMSLCAFLGLSICAASAQSYFTKMPISTGNKSIFSICPVPYQNKEDYLVGCKGYLYWISEKKSSAEIVIRLRNPQDHPIRIRLNDNKSNGIVVSRNEAYLSNENLKKWKIILTVDADEGLELYDGLISETKDGEIYIVSSRGFHVSKNEGKSWRLYEFNEEKRIHQIFETDQGLWLAGSEGVYKVSPEDYRVTDIERFRSKSTGEFDGPGNSFSEIEVTHLPIPYRAWLPSKDSLTVSYIDAGQNLNRTPQGISSVFVSSRILNAASEPVSISESKVVYPVENKLYLLNTLSGEGRYILTSPGAGDIHDIYYQRNQDILFVATENGIYRHENFASTQIYIQNSEISYRPENDVLTNLFKGEPSVQDVQIAAMRYAEVHPEKISEWRKQASAAPWLPQVSVGFDYGVDQVVELDRGGTNDPDLFINGPDEKDFNYDIQFTWNLSELIWNPDQTSIDNRSKLMVQLREDIISRVNASYFSRRVMILESVTGPALNPLQSAKKALQIQELEAELDAMTGGYFTKQTYSKQSSDKENKSFFSEDHS